MTVYQPELKLAAGNNNAAGLAILQSITPSGATQPFPPIINFGLYDPGERLTKTSGNDYFRGFPQTKFVFEVLPWIHQRYLMDTYCSGAYSGAVTVRLQTDTYGTYANFNATMRLEKHANSGRRRKVFIDYEVTFIHLEAL